MMKKKLKQKKPKRKPRLKKQQPVELSPEMNSLAWAMAKVMTKRRGDQTYLNKKVYCKICKQTYCLGFDGTDQFCRDCHYAPYYVGDLYIPNCQKECVAGVICQHCGG